MSASAERPRRETARPGAPAGPGMVRPTTPPAAGMARPAAPSGPAMAGPGVPPGEATIAPPAPARKSTAEIVELLFKEGRVTRGQLERYKEWEAAKPATGAAREKFEAWNKARPSIPHLEEYLDKLLQHPEPPVAPPPSLRPRIQHGGPVDPLH